MKHVNTITLRVGDYYYEANLDAFGDNECCCNISWYSEDPDIASVNPSGLAICGMSEGTTRICASVGNGEIYYLTVIVSGQIEVTGIHLNYTSKTLEIGDTFTLTAAVHPAYATNTTLVWTNENPSVATFEDGVVTAIASGTTEITVSATDGSGVTATCHITVAAEGVKLVRSINVNVCSTVWKIGDSDLLSVTISPSNASDNVEWRSSNSNVVTVTSDGIAIAHKEGTATIFATALDGSGTQGSCTITVKPNIAVESIMVCPEKLEMVIEEKQCLCATINPENATVTSLYWTSDDCNIADVDENGCVTAKAVGTTIIRANAKDESGVHGCCEATVNAPIVEETINALRAIKQCYVRIDTSLTTSSILEGSDGHDIVLQIGDTVYLLDREPFTKDNNRSWYRILYNGMMVYVTNDGSFEKTTLPSLEAPIGCDVTVRRSQEDLEIRCMPSESAEAIGNFANGTTVILTNEIPQNEKWYAVYGQTTDGTYSYGWCLGENITIATSIYEKTLNVRATPDSVNGTILGSISNGEEVRLITKNAITTNYTWHKILFNNLEAYVIAGQNSPNFTFETCVELRNSGNTDVSTLTPISGNYKLSPSEMKNNAKIIYDYLTNKVTTPWSKNAICALLGNMQVESTINPGRWQSGVGPGYGLVQWEYHQKKLFEYLEENGYEEDNLYGQLDYLIYQCEKGTDYWSKDQNYPSDLIFMNFNNFRQSALSVEILTRVFLWAFEKSSTPHEQNRINYANQWYVFFS